MRRRLFALICILALLTGLLGCGPVSVGSNTPFSITFFDVGQGDSALVECDGHYMLIDGGDVEYGDKVYRELNNRQIDHLDILAMSHYHKDHIGGLKKALTAVSKIDYVISHSTYTDSTYFREVEKNLDNIGATIKTPNRGYTCSLGTATVEVVDSSAFEDNDCLVLLVTYGKTKFLFTGDIEYNAQKRLTEYYLDDDDKGYKIDLIKMPHHGSYEGSLYNLIRTFEPDYAVISVGANNPYDHPHSKTLDLLEDADVKVYRTDKDGDITVKSDGKTIRFETSK